ncbi:MAG: hypothetical protein COU68_01980 [Candidatus Pacebacteria bacterium CG10_big_fil_rev_8_21_14_0_10_45_6]|nr:MAG: hypothetical protein COU68_01980 [Candidatus Pacebacteria bacterium CG10_big_fil_rev_8_21_14_0_10_45_6]
MVYMKKNNNSAKAKIALNGEEFIEHFWEKSWTYIKTVVDVVREPVLILDRQLSVMAANESFYRTFQVDPKETENNLVYELGNGQWNIPALRKLLEDILPKNTFFKGFEVAHDFPAIGRKVMILNARQIHIEKDETFPPIILLAIEDVTEIMAVAETLANHTKKMEASLLGRTDELESQIKKMERDISILKKAFGSSR